MIGPWAKALAPRLRRRLGADKLFGWRGFPGGEVAVLGAFDFTVRAAEGGLTSFMSVRKEAPAIVLGQLSWTHEHEGTAERTHASLLAVTHALTGVRLRYLANTDEELARFRAAGLPRRTRAPACHKPTGSTMRPACPLGVGC